MTPTPFTTPCRPVDSTEMQRRIAEAHRLRAVFLRDAVSGLLRRLHLIRQPVDAPRTAQAGIAGCNA